MALSHMTPHHPADKVCVEETGPIRSAAGTKNKRPTRQSDANRYLVLTPQLNTERRPSRDVHQESRNLERELAWDWAQTRPHFSPPEFPRLSVPSTTITSENQVERVWEEEGAIQWAQTRPDLLPNELFDPVSLPNLTVLTAGAKQEDSSRKEVKIHEVSHTVRSPLHVDSPELPMRIRHGPCKIQESRILGEKQDPVLAQMTPPVMGVSIDSDPGASSTYDADDEASTSTGETEDFQDQRDEIENEDGWASSRPSDKCSLGLLAGDDDSLFHASMHTGDDSVNAVTSSFPTPEVGGLLTWDTYGTQGDFQPRTESLWPEEGKGDTTSRKPVSPECDEVLVSSCEGPTNTSKSGSPDSGLSCPSNESVLKFRVLCKKEKLETLLQEVRKLGCVVHTEEISDSL